MPPLQLLPRHTGSGSILLDATDRDSLSSMCGLWLGWMMRHLLVWVCSTVWSHATVQFGLDGFIAVCITFCRFYTECNDALCYCTVDLSTEKPQHVHKIQKIFLKSNSVTILTLMLSRNNVVLFGVLTGYHLVLALNTIRLMGYNWFCRFLVINRNIKQIKYRPDDGATGKV